MDRSRFKPTMETPRILLSKRGRTGGSAVECNCRRPTPGRRTSIAQATPNSSEDPDGTLTSVPVSQGGLKLDCGLSDYDRTHRLTISYLWAIPGPHSGWMRYALRGWSLAA